MSQSLRANVPISLERFLRTGRFGPVELGATKGQLRAALGRPDDWSIDTSLSSETEKAGQQRSRRHREDAAVIWRYGSFEFHFNNPAGRVWLIFTDHFTRLRGGQGLQLDTWFLRGRLARHEVEEELRAAELPFTESAPADPACTEIKLESGILLNFVKEECAKDPYSPPPGLWAIQFPNMDLFRADRQPR